MTGDSYYGQPVIKPPVWIWEIPSSFFTGGVAGVSSLVALGAKAAGDEDLARRATDLGAGAAAVSPLLLSRGGYGTGRLPSHGGASGQGPPLHGGAAAAPAPTISIKAIRP